MFGILNIRVYIYIYMYRVFIGFRGLGLIRVYRV